MPAFHNASVPIIFSLLLKSARARNLWKEKHLWQFRRPHGYYASDRHCVRQKNGDRKKSGGFFE
jgi:hypothetical protein